MSQPDLFVGKPRPGGTPMWLRCGACQHVWVAAWLPMELGKVGRLLKRTHCPACAGGPRKIFLARKRDIPQRPGEAHRADPA